MHRSREHRQRRTWRSDGRCPSLWPVNSVGASPPVLRDRGVEFVESLAGDELAAASNRAAPACGQLAAVNGLVEGAAVENVGGECRGGQRVTGASGVDDRCWQADGAVLLVAVVGAHGTSIGTNVHTVIRAGRCHVSSVPRGFDRCTEEANSTSSILTKSRRDGSSMSRTSWTSTDTTAAAARAAGSKRRAQFGIEKWISVASVSTGCQAAMSGTMVMCDLPSKKLCRRPPGHTRLTLRLVPEEVPMSTCVMSTPSDANSSRRN